MMMFQTLSHEGKIYHVHAVSAWDSYAEFWDKTWNSYDRKYHGYSVQIAQPAVGSDEMIRLVKKRSDEIVANAAFSAKVNKMPVVIVMHDAQHLTLTKEVEAIEPSKELLEKLGFQISNPNRNRRYF